MGVFEMAKFETGWDWDGQGFESFCWCLLRHQMILWPASLNSLKFRVETVASHRFCCFLRPAHPHITDILREFFGSWGFPRHQEAHGRRGRRHRCWRHHGDRRWRHRDRLQEVRHRGQGAGHAEGKMVSFWGVTSANVEDERINLLL